MAYYLQIGNKKVHNIISSRVTSSPMGSVYIEAPYISSHIGPMYIETPYISSHMGPLYIGTPYISRKYQTLAWRLAYSPMARATGVQFQVETYQRSKKLY